MPPEAERYWVQAVSPAIRLDGQLASSLISDGTGARLGGDVRPGPRQIDAAKQKYGEIQQNVTDGAQLAMTSTDAYVRANPWRAERSFSIRWLFPSPASADSMTP